MHLKAPQMNAALQRGRLLFHFCPISSPHHLESCHFRQELGQQGWFLQDDEFRNLGNQAHLQVQRAGGRNMASKCPSAGMEDS